MANTNFQPGVYYLASSKEVKVVAVAHFIVCENPRLILFALKMGFFTFKKGAML